MSTTDNTINTLATKAWSAPSVTNIYEQTRPNYNFESVEFLLGKVGALEAHSKSDEFTIAELGAGTGKFTRAVLKILDQRSIGNVKITATEPVGQMCEKFKELVPDVKILQCPASDIHLPSNSADAILAAQSFHWFSDAQSVREIHRVLKPKGLLGIIWNLPDCSIPWINTIEEMLLVEYRKHNIPRPLTKEWLRQINNHGGFGSLNEDDSYRYSITHNNPEGIIEIYHGISVVAAADKSDKDRLLKTIENEVKSMGTKDGDNYTLNYVVEIKWFQKM